MSTSGPLFGSITVRRVLAAFCVAFFTFAVLVHSTHNISGSSQSSAYEVSFESDSDDVPGSDTQNLTDNHCCACGALAVFELPEFIVVSVKAAKQSFLVAAISPFSPTLDTPYPITLI